MTRPYGCMCDVMSSGECSVCFNAYRRQPLPIIPLSYQSPVETGPLVENYAPIAWSPSQPCKGAA